MKHKTYLEEKDCRQNFEEPPMAHRWTGWHSFSRQIHHSQMVGRLNEKPREDERKRSKYALNQRKTAAQSLWEQRQSNIRERKIISLSVDFTGIGRAPELDGRVDGMLLAKWRQGPPLANGWICLPIHWPNPHNWNWGRIWAG
jgi:hypothetical protein